MSTFAIYTYRFEQIKPSDKEELLLDNFPIPYCTDKEFEMRQKLFREFFKKNIPLEQRTFQKGKSTYVYDTIFIEGNTAIMKFGRLSKKSYTDRKLNDHKIEDYPWCYVVWDNRDGVQRMFIEQKTSAWKNTEKTTGTMKVAIALKYILDKWMSYKYGIHFDIGDGPVYKSDDFWEYVKHYPQGFTRVHFSFPPPNLGRLMTLGDNLNTLREETGGGVDADLKAPKGSVLVLDKDNPQTRSLIDLHSACGKEIKAYPKDSHAMIRISGDNLENDVVMEFPDALIPILTSNSLFGKYDFDKFIKILNSAKNVY